MINTVSILGSTGSIGRQTIEVCARLGISVAALTADKNIELLERQARRLQPRFVAVYDEKKAAELKIKLADTNIRVGSGPAALVEAAVISEADAVVTAVSGSVGLTPTLAAIEAGRRICLANKETLVCAGDIVMSAASEFGAEIIPVDSEHSAIFQCLQGRAVSELHKILLTASGGPFRSMSREQTKNVTPSQAVAHPNWSMGAKISVDSATMMNKGLEFIEAQHLFGVTADEIEVVIHPESIIHSMVELCDGTVIAQCGVPDMSLPIQYSLTYPDRLPSATERLDFTAISGVSFMSPDFEKTPCLALAMDVSRRGGSLPCAMNAANEAAVALFLGHRLGYNEIYDSVLSAVSSIDFIDNPSLEDILRTDRIARELVTAYK